MTLNPKDRIAKSRRIARAALGLFSGQGYAATTVDDIAKAAGVGKGTLYAYFSAKEDMFAGALKEWMMGFEQMVDGCLSGITDPEEKLYAVAEANIAFVSAIDPATARLTVEFLQQSLLAGGALYKRRHLMTEMYAGQRRMIVDILLDGISTGRFRPEIARDAEKIAINLLACFDGIFLHSIVSADAFSLQDQVMFYLDTLMGTIRAPGHRGRTTGRPPDSPAENRTVSCPESASTQTTR
jgi:AcrR family transcriptional regulator